jgi:hypothetical protein
VSHSTEKCSRQTASTLMPRSKATAIATIPVLSRKYKAAKTTSGATSA